MKILLSYNSNDKHIVEPLAIRLRDAGYPVWFDMWHIIAGDPWQEELEKALGETICVIVFLGTELGPWQNEEVRIALETRAKNTVRVIPVLLPGAINPKDRAIPSFLSRLSWVKFEKLHDDDAFQNLCKGIDKSLSLNSLTSPITKEGQKSASEPNQTNAKAEMLTKNIKVKRSEPKQTNQSTNAAIPKDRPDTNSRNSPQPETPTTKQRTYSPILVIGAGGTGVKVCQFIQSLADSGKDTDLKNILESGSMELIAIDTDRRSNDLKVIDPNLLKHKIDNKDEEAIPTILPKLKKNWLYLDRTNISNALASFDKFSTHDFAWGGKESDHPHSHIRNWFPHRTNDGNYVQLLPMHAKLPGAAQWRPLGRMALFLNAERIYKTIQEACYRVQNASTNKRPIQAFIVCSLAGGTGSGMFWDLAFFLQMIGLDISTSGMFLLAEPFENVDETRRLYPNTYAALKEIVAYKNGRKPITVEYPIGRGITFRDTNKPHPFEMVYLYQSFPSGSDVADVASSTIDASCYHLTQNLIALSIGDVSKSLDLLHHNRGGDISVPIKEEESSFCFSTTGTTFIKKHGQIQPIFDFENLRHHLFMCKSRVFSNGLIDNRIRTQDFITFPFQKGVQANKGKEYDDIEEIFDLLADELVQTKAYVNVEPTKRPVVFFQDLFRSAAEITRIKDYYMAYIASNNAPFFHIHRWSVYHRYSTRRFYIQR